MSNLHKPMAQAIAASLTTLTGDEWTGTDRETGWNVTRTKDALTLQAYAGFNCKHFDITLSMWIGPTSDSKKFGGDRLCYYSSQASADNAGEPWANVNGRRAGGGINVAITKTPEQIARDIVRRSLPMTAPAWAHIQASVKASNAYHARAAALADELASLAGVKAEHTSGGDHKIDARAVTGSGYGSITVYDDSVSMELRIITADQARVIMVALAGCR